MHAALGLALREPKDRMREMLENVLEAVHRTPAPFLPFCRDIHQVDPEARLRSIAEIAQHLPLPAISDGCETPLILDIGTGYGYGAVVFNMLGYHAIGIDNNKDKLRCGLDYWSTIGVPFLEISKPRELPNGIPQLCFMHRDMRDLHDFADNAADFAASFYVSRHKLGFHSPYGEVKRVLKERSYFAITTSGINRRFVPTFMRERITRLLPFIFNPTALLYKEFLTLDKQRAHDHYVYLFLKE